MSRALSHKKGEASYHLEQGPFKAERFETLGESHWSLLVQGVDRIHPEVSSLMDHFNFVPNWRLDDVMVSYASDKGSVGPHIDNYDVFLIQGMGKREWQINENKVISDNFVEGSDLRILKDFKMTQSYILEPGDMLYVPPRFAHHGIAIDESMTYSIGFRAPEHWDLLNSFSKYLAEQLDEDLLYEDPDLELQENAALIKEDVIEKMQKIMMDYLSDKEKLASWFGRYITDPKMSLNMPPEELLDDTKQLKQLLASGSVLVGMEGLKISFSLSPVASLFVEGYEIPLESKDVDLAKFIASQKMFALDDLARFDDESIDSIILDLYNRGYLYLCGE